MLNKVSQVFQANSVKANNNQRQQKVSFTAIPDTFERSNKMKDQDVSFGINRNSKRILEQVAKKATKKKQQNPGLDRNGKHIHINKYEKDSRVTK